MSKKPKYKADFNNVMKCDQFIADCTSFNMARKIARALNAMEDKPKAKAFEFDWTLVPSRFSWAAMDSSGFWYGYERKPVICHDDAWGNGAERWGSLTYLLPKYPGDWRDSLQKRP